MGACFVSRTSSNRTLSPEEARLIAGSTDILRYAVILIGLVASATDLARGRIYNWLTIPAWVLGLAYSLWSGGWGGLGSGFLATALAFLLYGWMFWIGVMGAGDVKLLMALGAWGGVEYVARTGLLGVFLGGAMAAVLLLVQGRLLPLLRKLYRFVLTLVIQEMVVEPPAIDKKLTMPFGIPISAAAIWIVIEDPLKKWGIL